MFVVVSVVSVVEMPVVEKIDVAIMLNSGVSTSIAMHVFVIVMMRTIHDRSPMGCVNHSSVIISSAFVVVSLYIDSTW